MSHSDGHTAAVSAPTAEDVAAAERSINLAEDLINEAQVLLAMGCRAEAAQRLGEAVQRADTARAHPAGCCVGYVSPVPLFGSGGEAADHGEAEITNDHGEAEITNPSPRAVTAMKKVIRARGDIES